MIPPLCVEQTVDEVLFAGELPAVGVEHAPILPRLRTSALYSVDVTKACDQSTITMSGEFDITSVRQVRDAVLIAIVDGHTSKLIFDLAKVTFMDCAGLDPLMQAANRMALSHGKTSLMKVPASVHRLVTALHLEGSLVTQR